VADHREEKFMSGLTRIATHLTVALGLTLLAGNPVLASSLGHAPVSQLAGELSCATPAHPGFLTCETVQAGRREDAGGGPVGYGPSRLQSAYDLPSSRAGMLKTVAVVAPFDDPNVVADLAAYRSYYDLPPCTPSSGCFREYDEGGGAIPPNSPPPANPTWALQTAEQLDTISAVCPNCRLILVEVNSASMQDVGTGLTNAINLGADVVTIGVSEPESSADITDDTDYFQDTKGVAITAAVGDAGYQEAGSPLNYPAASQYVTAVGGTTLNYAGAGGCTKAEAGQRGWCEKVWNDLSDKAIPQGTESGCSLFEPQPSWQARVAGQGCGSFRTTVDVAADADPRTGVAVYDTYGTASPWQQSATGGTSVSAAIVAGVYALAALPQSTSYPASYPYLHPQGLNDVTSGTDLAPGQTPCRPSYLCVARTGYDGPSGLGTPSGTLSFSATGSTTGVLYNGIRGMCADDSKDASSPGNKIQIWHCDGHASQRWTITSHGTIQIKGDCLDNTDGQAVNGNPMELAPCAGGAPDQQWRPRSDGEIVNPATGMCLDNYDVAATGHGTQNGTQLDLRTCTRRPNQQWILPYSDPIGLDRIISSYAASSSMCLDDRAGSYRNGNPVEADPCDNDPGSQAWTVEPDGTLQIGGHCLGVYGASITAGTKVQLQTCGGGINQRWQVLSDGQIVALDSESCLDEGDTPSGGIQLTISSCADQDPGQIWLLERYENNYDPR
jgi:hypothetical protein